MSIEGECVMLYNLDDCTSCQVVFLDKAKEFLKEEGTLVLITKHPKKANTMFEDEANILVDQSRLAKELDLEHGLPVIYKIRQHQRPIVDSIVVRQ